MKDLARAYKHVLSDLKLELSDLHKTPFSAIDERDIKKVKEEWKEIQEDEVSLEIEKRKLERLIIDNTEKQNVVKNKLKEFELAESNNISLSYEINRVSSKIEKVEKLIKKGLE